MKFKYIVILIVFWSAITHAQQEIIFTKYIYHSILFNPAYAGCHGFDQGTAVLHYRNQWLGLEGAPNTLLASFERSFADDKVGLGFSLGHETIGIDNRIDAASNFAYRIPLKKGSLAGGLRFGYSQYYADFEKLKNVNSSDPLYNSKNEQFSILSVGFGLYYNSQNFFVGLSMPSITAISNKEKSPFKSRHIYFNIGGMMGAETALFNVEPSLLISYQKAVPIQYTLGANLWYDKKFAIGTHLRSGDAFAVSSEIFFNNKWRFCLAYDFTISDIRKYESGSMEIMMAYHIYKKLTFKKIKHIRYGGRF